MVGYLELEGWIDGLTAGAIILSAVIFGLICIIKGLKNKARLLTIAGFSTLCIGTFWLGPFTEFLMVLILDTHITPHFVYGLLSYTMIGPGVIFVAILGGELIAPKYKKVLIIIMIITGGAFEFFLWVFTVPSFKPFVTPEPGYLLDGSFNLQFPTFFLIAFFLVYMLIFMATGFIIKAKQSSGELRKKFIYLALAFYIFVAVGVIDALFSIPLLVAIARIVMSTFALWMYLGLKT